MSTAQGSRFKMTSASYRGLKKYDELVLYYTKKTIYKNYKLIPPSISVESATNCKGLPT